MDFIGTLLINTRHFVGVCIDHMKILFILPTFFICLYVAQASAATIAFEPKSLSVKATPGERVYVPISVSLKEANSPSTFAYIRLAHSGGNLNRSWLINDQFQMALNSYNKSRQVLQIKPPIEAEPGVYTATMGTELLRSNESIELVDLEIHVEISQQDACLEPAVFSSVASAQDTINTRNNKQVNIRFSGTVDPPSGCELKRVWYELVDEYDECGHVGDVDFVMEGGEFTVDLPLIASRKGKDKDGRLYSIIFKAENIASTESAVAESVRTNIVVTHDSRK